MATLRWKISSIGCQIAIAVLIFNARPLEASTHAWRIHRDEKLEKMIDPQAVAREADRVINLPGQPAVDFKQYAGYITVNASHGRALFYWFIEASSSTAASKPLLLWLNGGPGCSSIGYGEAEEIGPFRMTSSGNSLQFNKLAWNNEANLLFLESPAGVGFSYSNTSSDYLEFGDKLTAEDAYSFLVNWFDRFPHYKTRDFYISGESYGGHYVPQLAELISDRNKDKFYRRINLKGFMIGNPALDETWDEKGFLEYAWSHAVISDQTYQSTKNACGLFEQEIRSESCQHLMDSLYDNFDPVDIYSLYTDRCLTSNDQKPSIHRTHKRRMHRRIGYDPCKDSPVMSYLNRADVQAALHANMTGIIHEWRHCSDLFLVSWTDSPDSMLPTLTKLVAEGLRIWVYRY